MIYLIVLTLIHSYSQILQIPLMWHSKLLSGGVPLIYNSFKPPQVIS